MECAVAVISVLIAMGATELLGRIDNRPTLFIFLAAVMVSTAIGGVFAGLLTLALSAVATAYFVLSPAGQLAIDDYGMIVRWAVLQAIGLLIIILHSSRRTVVERLSETDQRLRLALDAGRIGVWDYAVDTGEFWMSAGLGSLFGRNTFFKPTFEEFLELIHSEDREFFHQAVLRTLSDKVDYQVDFRIVRPDGQVRWFVTRGRGYTAAGSGGEHILGVISENATNRSPASVPDGCGSEKPSPSAHQRAMR